MTEIVKTQMLGDQTQVSWEEIFAALDKARFTEDFLVDRQQGVQTEREPLEDGDVESSRGDNC